MSFFEDIKKFNKMYNLPCNETPTNLGHERLKNFSEIFKEEVMEWTEIWDHEVDEGGKDTLVMMADWLGDLVVYCASEASRWGIPLEEVLGVIMQSNFSKLSSEGAPIIDERGKVMKGPNYWKPEPKIKELLERSKK